MAQRGIDSQNEGRLPEREKWEDVLDPDRSELISANAEHGAAGPETVGNLIKQRSAEAEAPREARWVGENVKRGAGAGGGGESGGGGQGLLWLAIAVLATGLAGGCFWGFSELNRLGSSAGGAESDGGGGEQRDGGGGEQRAMAGEISVLTERMLVLEKRLAGMEAGREAAGEQPESALLAGLENRMELARLGDEAIASAFRSVLRKIDSALDEAADDELQRCANAERARVEIYYLNGAGFFPLPLPEEQDGVPMAEIGTDRLAEYLLVAESPGPLRARAAQLLGRRMEVLSADALSESLMLEPDLRVLVHATASFRRVTGCPIPSVFGGPEMREWLTKNRGLVEQRFRDIAERMAAERQK